MGNDLRYQYDAGAAKETDLEEPTEDFKLERSL
jgi:hypothetical protein